MANTHTTLASLFSAIANAIRAKTGSSAQIVADDFPDAIAAIPTGGGGTDTSDATLTSGAQMLSPYTAYSQGTKYTGTIATKSASDLTASDATVTVPAGYYASQATKSVATTTHPAPTASINSSTGVVTASHTQTAGYVSAGTTTDTLNLTTQAGATITPTESEQTAVAAGKYTTGEVKVGAISPTYIGSGVTQKSATTYNTSSSDQTISSGQYLSGAQTIKAVTTSGISAANIKYGATVEVGDADDSDRIAGATGTFSGASTVSSGQTAAGRAQILDGYSAFVDGDEVKGTLASNGNYVYYITTKTDAASVTTPALYNSINVSLDPDAIADLESLNVAKGSTILGVSGSPFVVNTGIVINPATADKILSGYSAYVNGSLITGTASAGSGGLEYETGTWTPDSDIARGTVTFSDTHTLPPIFAMVVDATGTSDTTTNTNMLWAYVDSYRLTGNGYPYSSSAYRYGQVYFTYRGTSATSLTSSATTITYNSDNTSSSSTGYARYWATSTNLRPYSNSTSRYWRANRTYKWIAVWAPTT